MTGTTPEPAGAREDALRAEIVKACQGLSQLGLARGTAGNVSARARDGFLISPTGVPYDRLEPEMIVPMRMDGSFTGALKPSSEWRFHRNILAARADLDAIVHTHSPHATAVAIMDLDIPAIHYAIAAAGGATIRCAPYATFGTQALADNAITALEGRRACLLSHHGAIACGATPARALELAVLVEEMAQLLILSRSLGHALPLDDAEMARVRERYKTYGQQPSGALKA